MENKFVAYKISKLIVDAHEMYHLDRFDIEILLAHSLTKPREYIVANPDFFVPWPEEFKFQRLVAERAQGIPVAYLTGHKEFFGLDFLVNKDTLVPRPDTEILVEHALAEIKKIPQDLSVTIVDVGTGSGCIPTSIYKTLQDTFSISHLNFFATDISEKALAIAKKNARKHFVNITFLEGNLLEPILNEKIFSEKESSLESFIVTANLPYLTQEQFDEEPSIQHEPVSALVADDNGLALYKKLLQQIQTFIQIHKTSLTAFFEIDPAQTKALSEYIEKIFPQVKIEIKKDLAGHDRIVQFKI